ncbi:MAG: sodium:calcium antiporter [Candidatus Dojkabacteria bacterium]|nr:MAG: sodium:calcium antiporter [Candidatus Dojkabacteria bacterium]
MDLLLKLTGIVILLLLMIKSAGVIRSSLVSLSYRTRINYFISGFVLLSFASSLPEFSIAISSASQDVPQLSVGNLFGATLFLMTVTVGALAIKHRSIPFKTMFGRREVIMSLLLIFMMAVVVIDKNLSKADGVILISAYVGLILYLLFKTKRANDLNPQHTKIANSKLILLTIKMVIGVTVLIVASNFLVNQVVDVASILKIPEVLVGILILGIGTNTPELVVALTSSATNENKIAAGNVLGSATTNVAILGLVAILSPYQLNGSSTILVVSIILTVTCLILGYFAWTDKRIVRWEGIALVFLYLIMFVYSLNKVIHF